MALFYAGLVCMGPFLLTLRSSLWTNTAPGLRGATTKGHDNRRPYRGVSRIDPIRDRTPTAIPVGQPALSASMENSL